MLALLLAAALVATTEQSAAVIDDNHIGDFLQQMPGAWSIETLLQASAMQVVFGTETTLGFNRVDEQKLSVYGESYTWSRWSWNGVDISDPLFAGSEAFRLPFRLLDGVSVRSSQTMGAHAPGLAFDTTVHEGTVVGGGATTPQLGGYVPLAVPIMDAFSGSHPSQRTPPPPGPRRQFDNNGIFTLVDTARTASGMWRYAAEISQGERQYLAFNSQGFTNTFAEPYVMASFAAQYAPDNGAFSLQLGAEFRHRQNMFAELHYSPAETTPFTSGALFAALHIGNWTIGSTLKLYNVSAQNADFFHDQHDLTGEALNPYYPRGNWLGSNTDMTWRKGIGYVRVNQRWLAFVPSITSWSNEQGFDGVSLGRIDWQSRSVGIAYGSQEAGISDSVNFHDFHFSYDAYGFSTFNANTTGKNSLFLFDIGLNGQAEWRPGHGITAFLTLSRTPVPITANVAQFLTPGLLDGKVYAGNTQIDSIGGSSVSVAGSMLATKVHALALGMTWRFAKYWTFMAQGIGKLFDDADWVQFSNGTASNVTWSGDRYYLQPGAKSYRLGNAPWSQTPFYAGVQGQLIGSDRDRFMFTLGLSTMFSIGATAFGSGPVQNDIGTVNTSMANPNTRLFPVGNLDPDRAYIFKMQTGYRFVSSLWGFLAARFQDGQPFAFIDWQTQNNQVAATYATNKGSLYTKSGPRTDALIIVDAQLSYTIPLPRAGLRLTAMVANLLDSGVEMIERQPNGDLHTRASLELQMPRMAMFTAELLL